MIFSKYSLKVILLNLSIFVIWGKLLMFGLNQFKNKFPHYEFNTFNLNSTVEDFGYSYEEIILFNQKITEILNDLKNTKFFSIFKVNFDSECNVWTQNKICSFSTCSICQCDESEVPLPWKQDSFNDLVNKDMDIFSGLINKYNYSNNEWMIESDIDNKNGIFVNLLKNQHTWTGYQGQKIWDAIYRENCMSGKNFDSLCYEEKVFYKLISGLHANINLHLAQAYVNIPENMTENHKESLLTFENFTLPYSRVFQFPDRVHNVFYLESILIYSLMKSKKFLNSYSYDVGNSTLSSNIKYLVNEFEKKLEDDKHIFSYIKNDKIIQKFIRSNKITDLKMRFRNITAIMDCVGCQKCKLYGKLQMLGLGTMLKILVSQNDHNLVRNEIIAYLNLFIKIVNSVNYIYDFNNKIIEANKVHMQICIGSIIIGVLFLSLSNYIFIKKGYIRNSIIYKEKDKNNEDEIIIKNNYDLISKKKR